MFGTRGVGSIARFALFFARCGSVEGEVIRFLID
jgi:hypothetical protein